MTSHPSLAKPLLVVVSVRGGMITDARANMPLTVIVEDWDCPDRPAPVTFDFEPAPLAEADEQRFIRRFNLTYDQGTEAPELLQMLRDTEAFLQGIADNEKLDDLKRTTAEKIIKRNRAAIAKAATPHINQPETHEPSGAELLEALIAVLPYARAEAEGLEGFRGEDEAVDQEADRAWKAVEQADAVLAAIPPTEGRPS